MTKKKVFFFHSSSPSIETMLKARSLKLLRLLYSLSLFCPDRLGSSFLHSLRSFRRIEVVED